MAGANLSKNEKMNNNQWTKFCSKQEIIPCEFDQFPWPARNYVCSFCKREFKSAQALGGHMNVHRRDRAKLRLLPSWQLPALNPNLNPNFPIPPPSFFTPTYTPNNSLSSPPPLASLSSLPSATDEKTSAVSSSLSGDAAKAEKDRFIDLELKIGSFEGSEEDLDLELHL